MTLILSVHGGVTTLKRLTACSIGILVVFAISSFIIPQVKADPLIPCKIETYRNAWEGGLAYGLFQYDSISASKLLKTYLVIMGTDGKLLRLREDDTWSYFDVEYVSHDTLMYQGESNTATHFWNLKTNQITDFPEVQGHHDIEYNPDTNTFLTLVMYTRMINGSNVLFDKIVEFNEQGEILWNWDTYDYFSLKQECPYKDIWILPNGEAVIDLTHSNTVQWDYRKNIIYLNMRNLNTFCKIDKATGKLIWSCGEHGNFKLLDANGKEVSSLWYHSHAVKEVKRNVFLMFDNDYHNQTNPNNKHSRMIEVTLDEKSMTASISWSWTAPEKYWSPYWGDADRLPNGDRIGTFGTQTHFCENTTGAVLVEVDDHGNIVRTYTFPKGWGIYRIEQLYPPHIPRPDIVPPKTQFLISQQKYVDAADNVYISSATSLKLFAEDNRDGSGLASTKYRVYNSTYNSGWLTEPIAALWHFDEAHKTIAFDSSTYSNDAVIYGAKWVNGRFGKALSFDGVDDYVSPGCPQNLRLSGSLTITAWFKTASSGTWQTILGKGWYEQGQYLLIQMPDGKIRFEMFDLNPKSVDSSHSYNDGTWHFVSAVYNREASPNRLEIYVDGIHENGIDVTGNPFAGYQRVSIGRREIGNYWNGSIDEVCIYNRALNTSEVLYRFNRVPEYDARSYFTGLSDGKYSIVYNSTDNMKNVETSKTTKIILDNTSPTTTLIISEPKYASSVIYVTRDATLSLEAYDSGSGVRSKAYRIYSTSLDSRWAKYNKPFNLKTLRDGEYTIAYNSTDNVGNIEATKFVKIKLFSWNHIFEDVHKRGISLKTNTDFTLFQFITPDRNYRIMNATNMRLSGHTIKIEYTDSELRLTAEIIDAKPSSCVAEAFDVRTHSRYFLTAR